MKKQESTSQSTQVSPGVIYVVATPIGNLGDISNRALSILSEVDYILAEDTRMISKLLLAFGITGKKLVRSDSRTGDKVCATVLSDLEEGKSIALVTDAGTPAISDPGVYVIDYLYKNNPEIKVVAVPGASSLTAALSISGISSMPFTFLGFPPMKKGRKTFFEKLNEMPSTVAFFESPHRIMQTLTSLSELLPETRIVCVCRELTKMHEEVVRDNAKGVLAYFTNHSDHVRGEFVVIIGEI